MKLSHFTFPSRIAAQGIHLRLRTWRVGSVVGLLFIVGLAACAPALPPPPNASAPWPLGPGDHLRIIVFEQNQLGGEFTIDEDGAVSLPLVGRLKVAGLAPADAEQLIAHRLNDGIVKKPKVNIDVIRYRPVYVYGEVTKPGAYDFAGTPTVIGAITLAGGYTYRAQRDGLAIVRYADPERRRWGATDSTPIGPGDIIYVPERWF